MSLRSGFTDTEWRMLQKTPIWAFIVTASADGKVDPKEIEAFTKELGEAGLYKDELAREVFTSLSAELVDVLPSCLVPPQELLAGLRDVGSLLDKKAATHAQGFKGAVLVICKNVAEASGRRLRGKISKEEKERIVVVALALGANIS